MTELIELVAPADRTGTVMGESGAAYAINAEDGTVHVLPRDVAGLRDAGFTFPPAGAAYRPYGARRRRHDPERRRWGGLKPSVRGEDLFPKKLRLGGSDDRRS